MSLEQNLKDLETLVTRLEQAETPLEEALKAFEEGMALVKTCRQTLSETELKVEQIIADTGEIVPLEVAS